MGRTRIKKGKTTKQILAQAEYEERKRQADYRRVKKLNRQADRDFKKANKPTKPERLRYSKEAYTKRQQYKKEHKIKGNLKPFNFDIKVNPSIKNKNIKSCFNCNGWLNGKAVNVMKMEDITEFFNGSGISGLIKHFINNTETNKEAKAEELKDNVFKSPFKTEKELIEYVKGVEEQFKDWKDAPKLWIPFTIKLNTEDKELAQDYFKGIDTILNYYGYERVAEAEHFNEYHLDKKHKGQAHKHYLIKNFTEKDGVIKYGLGNKKMDKANLRTIRKVIEAYTKEYCLKHNLPYNPLPTLAKQGSKAGYRTIKGDMDYTRNQDTGQITGGANKGQLDKQTKQDLQELDNFRKGKIILKQHKDKIDNLTKDNKDKQEQIDKLKKEIEQLKQGQKTEGQQVEGIRWGEINSLPQEEKLKLLDKDGINIYILGQVKNKLTGKYIEKAYLNPESKTAQTRIKELKEARLLKEQGQTKEADNILKNSKTTGIRTH